MTITSGNGPEVQEWRRRHDMTVKGDNAPDPFTTFAAAQFPPDIAKEVDVLHVTRTWRFLSSAEFTAQ